MHIHASVQEWWRLDEEAPWLCEPSPSPFKSTGNVFAVMPGMQEPKRSKPDLVHTFHLGMGVDLVASVIVWLARLKTFPGGTFDEILRNAYSAYREYCHQTNRFTACDVWCLKKFHMSAPHGSILCRLLITAVPRTRTMLSSTRP